LTVQGDFDKIDINRCELCFLNATMKNVLELEMRKKGFTLIELLVVIAIIALLLSILLPALTSVKERGKAVVCAAHLKQWGVILSFYTGNNNDKFPSKKAGSRGQWWFLPIRSYYIEQPNILICGKAKIKSIDSPFIDSQGRYVPRRNDEAWGREIRDSGHPDNGEWVWSSYGPNAWLMDPIDGRWGGVPDEVPDSSFWGKFSDIPQPSRVPFYMDSRHVDSWPHDTDIPANYEFPLDAPAGNVGGSGAMRVFTMLRHGKSINAVFGDGSVQRTRITDLWAWKWHRTFNTNNDYANGTKTFPPWMR